MKTPKLATIFGVVFVDLLGFSLILPLAPEREGGPAMPLGAA